LIKTLINSADLISCYDGSKCDKMMVKSSVSEPTLEKKTVTDTDGPKVNNENETKSKGVVQEETVENKSKENSLPAVSYASKFDSWVYAKSFDIFKNIHIGLFPHVTRSSAQVLVDSSRAAVERVGGGEGLLAGDRVTIDRGSALVLGACNGYLWYRVDTEDHAWYWSVSEAEAVRKAAIDAKRSEAAGEAPAPKAPTEWACAICTFLNPVGIPECSCCGSPKEDEDDFGEQGEEEEEDFGNALMEGDAVGEVESPDEALVLRPITNRGDIQCLPGDIQTEKDFVALVTDGSAWSAELDASLVKLVNQVCDEKGCEAHHLSANVVLESLNNAGWQDSSLSTQPHGLIIARFAILLLLNECFLSIFPYVEMDVQSRYSSDSGGIVRLVKSSYTPLRSLIGHSLTSLRRLLFKRNKLQIWRKMIKATETYVSPPLDEYESPSDIPKLKVNRIIANGLLLKDMDFKAALSSSIFGQLYHETYSWSDSSFRKSYVDIQDAGQERAFYVKFLGEGVDDHGGPYRAIFQAAVVEEPPLIGLVKPCVNEADSKSMNRDKVVFDATKAPKYFHFLGKLVGLAVRHSLMVPLNFPELIWKPMVGLRVDRRDLAGINKSATDAMKMVETWREEDFNDGAETALDGLAKIFNNVEVTYVDGQGREYKKPLSYENRLEFIKQAEEAQLKEMNEVMSAFFHGLVSVLPSSAFPLFTPEELEAIICGAPEIDIELLKKVTEYEGEGVHSEAPHVKYFWQSLEKLDQDQRSRFVNFVSARSRLPASADEFAMNFKIVEPKPAAKENPDSHLPHSQTCFFTLSLPFYSCQEVCFKKLLYAIDNATTMDDDFQNRETWGGNN
jgi:hypothetical protein